MINIFSTFLVPYMFWFQFCIFRGAVFILANLLFPRWSAVIIAKKKLPSFEFHTSNFFFLGRGTLKAYQWQNGVDTRVFG